MLTQCSWTYIHIYNKEKTKLDVQEYFQLNYPISLVAINANNNSIPSSLNSQWNLHNHLPYPKGRETVH